ncbi:MAG: hypothetical protein M1457_02455 [bacterium]|nr:hypothetical protein [bacterium]
MRVLRTAARCIFYELRLRRPPGAKAGTEPLRPVHFVRVGEHIGEACPSLRGGETIHENRQAIEAMLGNLETRWLDLPPTEAAAQMREAYPLQPSARTAIELILHDRAARAAGKPLYAALGLDPPDGMPSCFPMTLGTEADMERRLAEGREFTAIKVKYTRGAADDLKALRWLAQHTGKALRIDGGGLWTFGEAREALGALHDLNIEYIMQPLPPHRDEETRELRRVSPVPLFADLDVGPTGSLEHLAGIYDGISVRLMSCGGIAETLRMMRRARELGLRVSLGSTIESSAAATAAAHLAAEADYINLCGHLLVENDPIDGLTLCQGRLHMPSRPGLGIAIRQEYLDYLE